MYLHVDFWENCRAALNTGDHSILYICWTENWFGLCLNLTYKLVSALSP